jgi:hypothetical protein
MNKIKTPFLNEKVKIGLLTAITMTIIVVAYSYFIAGPINKIAQSVGAEVCRRLNTNPYTPCGK